MLKKDKTRQTKIKLVPASGYRTQADWTQYFKSINQRMISAPDVHTVWYNDQTEELEMLIKIFKDRWLNTSTQVEYDPTNLSVTVIHDAGSKQERRIRLECVPHYDWIRLDKVTSTKEGLSFLNALFETKYDENGMIHFLESLSSKKAKKIAIWTPSQSSRAEKPIRSVGILYSLLDGFDISCDFWYNYDGGSFGVISDSEPKARTHFKGERFNKEDIRADCEREPMKAIAKMMYNERYKKRA